MPEDLQGMSSDNVTGRDWFKNCEYTVSFLGGEDLADHLHPTWVAIVGCLGRIPLTGLQRFV